MFYINFTNDRNKLIDSVFYREFRIKLGDFEELLLAPLDYWSVKTYQTHWEEQLHDFVTNNLDKIFLITEMHDPATANFIRWWIIYRQGENVCFQEEIVFMNELKDGFSLDNAISLIPPHQNIDEDGDEISEWILPFKALIRFQKITKI